MIVNKFKFDGKKGSWQHCLSLSKRLRLIQCLVTYNSYGAFLETGTSIKMQSINKNKK